MPDDSSNPRFPELSAKEFFEATPPGKLVSVPKFCSREVSAQGSVSYPLNLPLLELHCDDEYCAGIRLFEPVGSVYVGADRKDVFVGYRCRNCGRNMKKYALRVLGIKESAELDRLACKYGEIPTFGSPTPARVITLLGPEREYYLKGRRAENQGMGIAAFAYYRRVVENQKNRLIDEIMRVAEKIGATPEMLDDLERAKVEAQFSTAVGLIKHGIPSGLLINGHNPLTLLHSALSEGLHAQTDEECLAIATSIRLVLVDLADRLGHALKERAELNAAVSKLMK